MSKYNLYTITNLRGSFLDVNSFIYANANDYCSVDRDFLVVAGAHFDVLFLMHFDAYIQRYDTVVDAAVSWNQITGEDVNCTRLHLQDMYQYRIDHHA